MVRKIKIVARELRNTDEKIKKILENIAREVASLYQGNIAVGRWETDWIPGDYSTHPQFYVEERTGFLNRYRKPIFLMKEGFYGRASGQQKLIGYVDNDKIEVIARKNLETYARNNNVTEIFLSRTL